MLRFHDIPLLPNDSIDEHLSFFIDRGELAVLTKIPSENQKRTLMLSCKDKFEAN